MACQNLVDPASSPSQVRGFMLGPLPGIWGLHLGFAYLIKSLKLSLKTLKSTSLLQKIPSTHLIFYTTLLPVCWCIFVCQVLSAATIVAKHTSALCNACRLASSKTSNPVARRQFVQSAKEVANTTANLVKTIKVISPTDQNVECKFVTEFFSSRGKLWVCVEFGPFPIHGKIFIHHCLVSGLGWGFFGREQKQVPRCYDTTPWGCRKPVNLCQQPWVCEHPGSDQQWGIHLLSCLFVEMDLNWLFSPLIVSFEVHSMSEKEGFLMPKMTSSNVLYI